MIHISKSASDTKKIGSHFAKTLLEKGESDRPLLVGLKGDLGSGKTTFVQGMARGMGIDPDNYVNSPTFTMINQYQNLVHVDLYRVEKLIEQETLGLDDYFLPKNVIVIEWVEKAPSLQKGLDFEIDFEAIGRDERRIIIRKC